MPAIDWTVVHNQALALFWNLWSWAVSFLTAFLRARPPPRPPPGAPAAVAFTGPGGLDRMVLSALDGRLTVGYNVPGFLRKPYVEPGTSLPDDCVVLCNEASRQVAGVSRHRRP